MISCSSESTYQIITLVSYTIVCSFDFDILFAILCLRAEKRNNSLIFRKTFTLILEVRKVFAHSIEMLQTVIIEGTDFCSITFWETEFRGL
jgi:hypothetical protein